MAKLIVALRNFANAQQNGNPNTFFFESRDDCSCRGVFCRPYEEPLQGRDNGGGASLE